MTMDECREYLPEDWLPLIEADPLLREIFEEHPYDLEQEAVPPFLIQELRGGNLERLRPILALYGQPGLELLQGLLEIDEAAKDTAEMTLPDGRAAYAGYFFANPKQEKEAQAQAVKTAKRYLRAVCLVYKEVFHEPSPVGELAGLLHEALYHINNDFFLSYYLQWPLVEHPDMENPFRPHFELWKMGWSAQFFDHDQMALVDC